MFIISILMLSDAFSEVKETAHVWQESKPQIYSCLSFQMLICLSIS